MKFIIMVCAAFFARREAGFDHREAGLHEHDEEAGDQRPHEVDGDLVVADGVHDFAERRVRRLLDRDVLGRAGRAPSGRSSPARSRPGRAARTDDETASAECQQRCYDNFAEKVRASLHLQSFPEFKCEEETRDDNGPRADAEQTRIHRRTPCDRRRSLNEFLNSHKERRRYYRQCVSIRCYETNIVVGNEKTCASKQRFRDVRRILATRVSAPLKVVVAWQSRQD